MTKVLFICMGNICRSPTAEGVFRHRVTRAGQTDNITIDSAGTHAYHVGSSPDGRAQTAAAKRGIDLSTQRARRVSEDDFAEYDYVVAMDESNVEDLLDICPANYKDRVHLFLDFAKSQESEVPDPYYGQGRGFEIVLDLIEDASSGLLEHINKSQ